eukprot:551538-Rhodomonas_salina.3
MLAAAARIFNTRASTFRAQSRNPQTIPAPLPLKVSGTSMAGTRRLGRKRQAHWLLSGPRLAGWGPRRSSGSPVQQVSTARVVLPLLASCLHSVSHVLYYQTPYNKSVPHALCWVSPYAQSVPRAYWTPA